MLQTQLSEGFSFELLHVDKHCGARLGRLTTPRGVIDLPTFMPVGTVGSVKGLSVSQVLETGAQIILGNTYHLALRPGDELIAELGGLHQFNGWSKPILTDSGGFQVFSLAELTKINDTGVTFRSHVDGSLIELTPERSIEIQQNLGSDIAMVLDQVPALPATNATLDEACRRTLIWAERCRQVTPKEGQVLFGITQGGLDVERRRNSTERLIDFDFEGYAIGGLSVGEPPDEMHQAVFESCPFLPDSKPRYLMGVGRPEDLLASIACGVDMFDCVMPTRNGRNAMAFTDGGHIRIRNSKYKNDPNPIDSDIQTSLSGYSRAYIRHLFSAGEMLGPVILSMHNLAYYQKLMVESRQAIAADSFLDLLKTRFSGWNSPMPVQWNQ